MAELQNGHSEPEFVEQRGTAASQSPDGAIAEQLDELTALVRSIARQHQDKGIDLLALLRCLESLHREIRDGLFQAALPENRQALYALLKDIEAGGGWPYIPRMKLQAFVKRLSAAEQEVISEVLGSYFSSSNHRAPRSTAESESLEW